MVYALKDVVRVSLQSVVEDECVAAFGGPGVRQDGSRVLMDETNRAVQQGHSFPFLGQDALGPAGPSGKLGPRNKELL